MPYKHISMKNNVQRRRKRSATALGYDPEQDDAPRILATGQQKIAERIIEVALEHGIPIREDPVLAAALATLDVDDTIPPELYAVVAELLAWVYRIQQKTLPG